LRPLCLLIVAASTAAACASTSPPVAQTAPPTPSAGNSYVPWLALPPTQQIIEAPPTVPPAMPPGTPACKGSQLEGEWLGEAAATGNVDMPLQFRNRSSSACYVHGYPDVTVLSASGRTLARGAGADGRGTFFADGPDVPVLLPPNTPGLPTPKLPVDSTNLKGQAFMNFSWYDCPPLPQAARLALDLPDGGGRLIVPFAVQAYFSAACGNGQTQLPAVFRGPFGPTGVRWPPPPDTIAVTLTLSMPVSVRRGATLDYFVTIRNDGSRDYVLQPCPDYFESLAGMARALSYQLNCSPAGSIAPGGTAKFEMHLQVPIEQPTGLGDVNWGLDDGRIDPSAAPQTPILITP